jgi:hypothetical protein
LTYERTPNDLYEIARRRKWARRLVDRLLELEEKSDPAHGQESARGKDERAFEALEIVGEFAEEFAGWAIWHKIGMARESRERVPRQPYDLQQDPEYLANKAGADDHRHEKLGAQTDWDTSFSADQSRHLLIHLLDVFIPLQELSSWRKEIIDALDAVKYGSTPELFKPADTTARRDYEIRQLELRAIEFVAFRHGRDGRGSHHKAVTQVAGVYGVSSETLLSWQKRRRQDFGRLEINRQKVFAKNCGTNFAEVLKRCYNMKSEVDKQYCMQNAKVFESRYSDAQLSICGTRYQQLLREGLPEKRGA